MAIGTNGIATWGDLRDLEGLNIPANLYQPDTKCPRREQIQNYVNSNYTLTFKREYGPFKLVRYEDIVLTKKPSRIYIGDSYVSTSGVNLLYFRDTTVYQLTSYCEIYNDNFSDTIASLSFSLKDGYYLEIEHVDLLGDGYYWLGIPLEVGASNIENAMIFWFNVKVISGVMSRHLTECYYDLRHYACRNVIKVTTEPGGSSNTTSISFSLRRINNNNGIIESFNSLYTETSILTPFPHVVYGQNNQDGRIELRTYYGSGMSLAVWSHSGTYNLLPSGYIYSWSSLISYHKNGELRDLRLESYY
jgi:hypothetical protein